MAENRYITGYAKLGTSSCKKCKQKIDKGSLRIGKVVSNPFSDEGGDMKQWYHPQCIFETLKRARATTKKIEEPDDLEGFTEIEQSDKDLINKLIKEFAANSNSKSPGSAKKKPVATVQSTLPFSPTKTKVKVDPDDEAGPSTSGAPFSDRDSPGHRDDSFREFRRLCADISDENSYLAKTKLVQDFINKGSSGDGYKGDLYLLMKCLLPGVVKQVYNLNSKQLVKLFSQIFGTDQDDMIADLDQGDVAETVRLYFEQSKRLSPQKKSTLTLPQVDDYLTELTKVTKEEDQQRILTKVAKRCTGNDLKMFVRLIKHDLRINSGAKHMLDALDDNAYAAFQASRDLRDVVDRVMENKGGAPGLKKTLSVKASLMTPVLPMLAEACRSVDQAMKKCPNGFYAEIKYDGERVQLHKRGNQFQYFSRSLKPVLPHKVQHFKEYIPKAFPTGDDLILDAEVLLVDNETSKPLPFGTLGVHKKAAFKDATVCLFVFDCLHLNGENIMHKPIKERKKILESEMNEIPNRIMFSEAKLINDPDALQELMTKVFSEGLEGLVLKDTKSIYKPGKRHWLKIKKDYLEQGTMADSADLLVLGAYYGTGKKGGLMSTFLFGVHDPSSGKWCTVTKCHIGLDDKTLEELQTSLDMVKISKNPDKVPDWLNIKKQLVPDFVARDPKKSPVWEISGAEFSKADIHTADGISIRFPRITKFRDDKTWENATDLPRLKKLYKISKETTDLIPSPSKGTPKKKSSNEDEEDDNNNEGDDSGTDVNSDDEMDVSPVKKTPVKGNSTPSKTTPLKVTPIKNGIKRSYSDKEDSETTPSKKSKPMCKYGAECYQTNPKHLEQFCHPPKILPNVFRGCKIFLPKDIDQYKTLRRYIIGWDGELVQEYDKASATHVVIPDSHKGEVIKCAGVCVTLNWLKMCIKKNMLVRTDPYIVGDDDE
ncbi:DNA ligase 3-like [Saccostrea echinata]|uniref:DNA ligase 3-like n=1 Tax=Saccostrea echinata TaxID=191078 RepID=UPI002A82A7D3|nr:DNA ligase 3-like [Saccostrea echinata]